jgi:hypothetical protein
MDRRRQATQLEVQVTDESRITRIAKLGSTRYRELVAHATHGVLESPGHTDPKLRWAVAHHRMDDVPPALVTYLEKVRGHAYRVTDEDVEALKHAGYSEDAIFELTVSAAIGAALVRLERGLIALNESKT